MFAHLSRCFLLSLTLMECTVPNAPSLKDDGLYMITNMETKQNRMRLSRAKAELTINYILLSSNPLK